MPSIFLEKPDPSVTHRLQVVGLPIHPTHSCFDDATHILTRNVEQDASLRMVHAICLDHDGNRIAHAWVESARDNRVYFAGIVPAHGEHPEALIMVAETCKAFYRQMKPRQLTFYTLAQAIKADRHHGHAAPWKECYRELCNDAPPKPKLTGLPTANPRR